MKPLPVPKKCNSILDNLLLLFLWAQVFVEKKRSEQFARFCLVALFCCRRCCMRDVCVIGIFPFNVVCFLNFFPVNFDDFFVF